MAHDIQHLLDRARRALGATAAQKAVPERYKHIDFSPPDGVRAALRRGLDLHEQGHSGDGLKPETVAWATRLVGGERISPEKAREMFGWFARHRAQGAPDRGGEPTPKLVSDLLWGGDPGRAWSGKLVEQMDAADRAEKGAPASLAERARGALAMLRAAKAVWTTAYINDLPDSAFLYIEAGGAKDAAGKTTPRTLRHFPVRDASGELDLPHLQNAIAQAPKAKLPQSVIEQVQAEGRRLLARVNEAKKEAITTADLGPGATPPQVGIDEEGKPKIRVLPQVVGEITPAQASAPEDAKKADDEGPISSLPPKLVDFGGIPVLVDRPKGFVQRKVGDDGAVLWERTYQVDYGGLAGTDGGDHELLDVFLGPESAATMAWWVVQVNDDGVFDEYKLLLGFPDEAAARACYVAHIPARFLASLTPMPIERLRALLGLPLLTLDPATKAAPARKSAPVLDIARLTRGAKALVGAVTYTGNTRPAEEAPAAVRAIVETTALSWRYHDPDAVGGWLGGIEPADERWVAFVAVDGKVLLWTEREEAGGVVGEPFLLWRPDLARQRVELVASTKAATPDEQFIFGIVLKPEAKDLQDEIYAHKVVRQTGHDWMAFYRNTDLQHKVFINDAVEPVESTIEKVAFWMARDGEAFPADPTTGAPLGAPAGAQLRYVPKGAWTVAHRVKDAELWAAIKRGEYTGYSINGLKKMAAVAA